MYQKDISEERRGDTEWRSYIGISQKREVKKGKEQEQRSEKQVSEDRRGDRQWRTYIEISQKRERGREVKSKSRDLSNRSLKTDGETESGAPT